MQPEGAAGFGPWLKRRRKQLDLTQGALCQLASCAIDTLRSVEAGRMGPSRQLAELLVAALEVPAGERAALSRVETGHHGSRRPGFAPVLLWFGSRRRNHSVTPVI